MKIAETPEEWIAASRLLHDNYVQKGFMQPNPSGIRLTFWHALPGTTVVVAKWCETIVGTFAIVRDNPHGLPLEQSFDLRAYRGPAVTIGEWSALAVDPNYRGMSSSVYMMLVKFMYHYTRNYMALDYYTLATHPAQFVTFQAIFLAHSLPGQHVKTYDFACGQPAIASCLHVEEIRQRYAKVYGNKPKQQNLHDYMLTLKLPHLKYPKRQWGEVTYPQMNAALYEHLFHEISDYGTQLSERERMILHWEYDSEPFHSTLGKARAPASKRLHIRYPVSFTARLGSENGARLKVLDVSRQGFRAATTMQTPPHVRPYIMEVPGRDPFKIEAKPVRKDRDNYGFEVRDQSKEWLEMADYLDKRRFGAKVVEDHGRVPHPLSS